jgi:hypothetical protein
MHVNALREPFWGPGIPPQTKTVKLVISHLPCDLIQLSGGSDETRARDSYKVEVS